MNLHNDNIYCMLEKHICLQLVLHLLTPPPSLKISLYTCESCEKILYQRMDTRLGSHNVLYPETYSKCTISIKNIVLTIWKTSFSKYVEDQIIRERSSCGRFPHYNISHQCWRAAEISTNGSEVEG